MEPVILFTSPPNFEELCGVTVLVKPSIQPHLAYLQPHITKCREIIFTEPDVLASPSFDLNACFNIVMQQNLFKSGRVQARLQKLGCQLSKPYRVLPSLYQACLQYTMLARLAPVWNRAGEWLLQGRDFLMHTGYTNAIKMKLCVNKDEMFVSLCGTVARFPPLQVEDLNLSREEMLQIVKCTEDGVSEVMLADSWCHVLPSMKRGRIMYVSLNISRQSPFTCYRDLQRYWKNTYGYRLPETDEDILYCQVCFLPSGGGKYFTYPSVCLRKGPMQVVQRVDPKPILTTFLQDVHGRVGAVCGCPLRFQPKVSFAYPSLHAAGEETRHISLSSKPVSQPVAPMRSQQSISHLFNITNTDRQATVTEKLYKQTAEKTTEDTSLVNEAQTERRLEEGNENKVRENNDNDDLSLYTLRKFSNMDKQAPAKGKLYEQQTEKSKEDTCFVNIAHTEKRLPQENKKRVKENHDKDDLDSCTIRQVAENPIITQPNGKDSIICHSQYETSVDQVIKYDSGQHSNTQPVVASKFVPHFRPKQKCHVDRKEPASENADCRITKQTSFKPVFKPCLSKATLSKKDKTEANSSKTNSAIHQSSSSRLSLGKNKTSTAKGKEEYSSPHALPVPIPQPHALPVPVPNFRKTLKQKCLQETLTKSALPKSSVNSTLNDFKMAAERTKKHSPRGMMKLSSNSDSNLPDPRLNNILQPPDSSVSKTPTVTSTSTLKIASERTPQQSPRCFMKSPCHSEGNLTAQRLQETSLMPVDSSVAFTRVPPSTPILFSKCSQESNGWGNDGTQDPVKRKKVPEAEGTPKKPRVKPQIQNLDVEALARLNQLSKVNTVTLIAWLKDRSVICRSKDKKNDLVDKVNSYITASKPKE